MARIRYIKPEFFDSEQVASVSMTARLLFAGLWTVADREGRFEMSPRRLKARLLPYDDVSVEALLDELIAAQLIHAYRIGGVLYGAVPGFAKHQRPHPNEAKSTIPPCPPDGVLPSISCNVTSRNDACTHSRGERNGDGEGTEREGTAPAPVIPLARKHHGDHFGFRPDPNAAWTGAIDGRPFSLPEGWAKRARNDYALTHEDIDKFGAWLVADVEASGGVIDDKGKRFQWLDMRLAAYREARRTTASSAKAVDATQQLLAQMRAAQVAAVGGRE